MIAGQRKPERQWTTDERKADNLDQRLKSLIMSVLPDDQMNSVINCLAAKSMWDDLILNHEGPFNVKERRVMDLKLCYNTFKFKEGETLTQTFTKYKALMNELVNDGIKLSKLEINTGFIDSLPKKWLSFCQSLINTNHVKYSELASLFEDTRSSHEYLNDLEEEYQARAHLAKSKIFFKKGTQRIISLERKINPRNPQHAFKKCEAYGSPNHTITDHYDIEALQAKNIEALKSTRAESSNANKSKNPTKSRLAHLNFKTINKLAKQNLVIGLPSVVYSKDKPCSSCEKGKHHRARFKIKQTSSIKKCLHLLHMNLFRHVTPRSINHEKYILVIVDEYSRYTWVYFLMKKSQAPETIMSFIKRVENQNDIKVKQLRTNNGTKFRNSTLFNFCDKKGISQKFSSPYTPEQNGVAERKNKTLIEATRTMLSGSGFSKQYWTEAIATACYTQNRSTIVKRHLKTPYEFFRKRIPNISFLHVFGCPVYIHNHKNRLGKFNKKADDGYLLGYSLVSK
nr:ribonuclease H-like domain-containing protein [Tanacetum cinerariifolium]